MHVVAEEIAFRDDVAIMRVERCGLGTSALPTLFCKYYHKIPIVIRTQM